MHVAKMHEYANDFFTVLEKVQATTDFIPADLVIRDECGISRTIRRSLTAHARNMDISPDLINAINRWKTGASVNPHLAKPPGYERTPTNRTQLNQTQSNRKIQTCQSHVWNTLRAKPHANVQAPLDHTLQELPHSLAVKQ
jgi:hypothetical protein